MKRKLKLATMLMVTSIVFMSTTVPEEGEASRPFWGEVCEYHGVSVAPDGESCVAIYTCTRYRSLDRVWNLRK